MKGMSIRWRLTLWYGLVLAIVLAIVGGAVYVGMRHELLARTDVALGGELDEISGGYPGRQRLDEALGAVAAALRPTRGIRVSSQSREAVSRSFKATASSRGVSFSPPFPPRSGISISRV